MGGARGVHVPKDGGAVLPKDEGGRAGRRGAGERQARCRREAGRMHWEAPPVDVAALVQQHQQLRPRQLGVPHALLHQLRYAPPRGVPLRQRQPRLDAAAQRGAVQRVHGGAVVARQAVPRAQARGQQAGQREGGV